VGAGERGHVTAIGVVTGLAVEAAVARHAGLAAEACGAHPSRATEIALRLVDGGARALASFGVAGGLDPLFRPGDLIVACEIAAEGGRIEAATSWRDRIVRRLPGARVGVIAGAEGLVGTAEAKRALQDRTGAAAVDMESHRVAMVARDRALPFVAIRAIADRADQGVPAAALAAVGPDGRVALGAGLRLLLRHPVSLPDLIRTGWATRRALAALAPAAAALAVEPPEDIP
jgi:adenosylhomocysteine nucleosidase